MRFEHAQVLLTGATGGIGRVVARRLQEKGALLTLTGRDEDRLVSLARELSQVGAPPQIVVADLTTTEGVAELVAKVTTHGQSCDILINNAGQIHFGSFQDQSPESIAALYQTNLLAPVQLMQALLPSMLERKHGLMVCMGSALGAIGYPFHSVASSCKFGLRGFCQALRRELQDSGVRIAYVAPRTTRTSMNSDLMLDMAKNLGNAIDEPDVVADAVVQVIEGNKNEHIIGQPERVFAKLNALFPSLVDRALSKQHSQMRGYATQQLKLVKESDIIKKP